MMVLVLAFLTITVTSPISYVGGPSPYICSPSGAGMQATCREKAARSTQLRWMPDAKHWQLRLSARCTVQGNSAAP